MDPRSKGHSMSARSLDSRPTSHTISVPTLSAAGGRIRHGGYGLLGQDERLSLVAVRHFHFVGGTTTDGPPSADPTAEPPPPPRPHPLSLGYIPPIF